MLAKLKKEINFVALNPCTLEIKNEVLKKINLYFQKLGRSPKILVEK